MTRQQLSLQGNASYVASETLEESVNLAMTLERPLLVRGEPGTGKTLLAKAVSEALGLPLHCWNVKSTSKAQEGLYTYDTVKRHNDSRFSEGDVDNIEKYIKLGSLGTAFASSEKSIVLIDEIDKADVEFPNDLLHEIDEMSFTVIETGKVIKANQRPIIIITSNAEKELPDAFLRRCIFHYIAFPEPAQMEKIVRAHLPDLESKLITKSLEKFYWLRDQQQLRKKPSTSEYVDWVRALVRGGVDLKEIERQLPFIGVLLKKEGDLDNFFNGFASTSRSKFY